MSESRYIFLSYRSSEADFALKLAADLKNAGVNLWMDRLDINPGDDWRKSLERAVYNCAAVISILSPAYVASKYCQRELARADRLGRPVFPVLLGSIAESDWPLEIERQQFIDFSTWEDEATYNKQLHRLVDILKEKFAAQISVVPDPQTQYLTNLTAEIEAHRGLSEYLELSTEADKWLNRDLIRPEPDSLKFWSGHTTLTLLEPTNIQHLRAYRKRIFKQIDELLEKYPRIILIGDPGIGKTSTLRRLVLDAIYAYQVVLSDTPLPLLLDLIDWDDSETLDDFVRAAWPLDTDPIKLLGRGQITLYVDGLSEMGGARAEKIQRLREWLHSENAPQRVIMTCRTEDQDAHFSLGLPVVQIGYMDRSQIERFAVNYLGEELGQIFLTHILPRNSWEERHKQHLYQLARDPFLLGGMILAHKSSQHGDLPDNLGMLMQRVVSEIWEREYGQTDIPQTSFEELETALSDLAHAMIEDDASVYVPYSYAIENIGSDVLLEAARKIHVIECRGGHVRFAQQKFQDYFAAVALARKGISAFLSSPTLTTGGQYVPGKWDSAIIMYSGLTYNPDETLLEIANYNPFLALECISRGANASELTIEPIIGKLIQIANTRENDARVATAGILARINHELATPILLEAMRDGSWDVRWAATLTLQDIDIPVLSGLTDVLWELEHDIQDAADMAVHHLGPSALPTLLKLLQSDTWKMRRSAAWALGRVRDEAAVPGLVQMLYDEDNLVSTEAAAALGDIKDEAAIPWLIQALNHASWRVRKAAAHSLGHIGKPAFSGLIDTLNSADEDVRRLVIDTLKESYDPTVTSALLEATHHPNVEVRAAAVDALKGRPDAAVVERLRECLADQSRIRWSRKRICDIAAHVLATIDTPDARIVVEQWQKDGVPLNPKHKHLTPKTSADQAKTRLKRITRNLGETEAAHRSAPGRLPAEPDWTARRQSVLALKDQTTSTETLSRLRSALDDPAFQVRLAAVETLAAIGSSAALDHLASALRDDDQTVVEAVCDKLREVGKAGVPALSQLLTSEDINIRARVIQLLGEIGDGSAIPHLMPLIDSAETIPQTGESISELAARVLNILSAPRTPTAPAVQPTVTPITEEPTVPKADVPLIVDKHREILTELLASLRRSNWGQREDTAKALREYARTLHGTRDPHICEQLSAAMTDSDWVVRWAVAEALAWIGDPAAVPVLINALNDKNWMVRIAATRALLEIGDKAATIPITRLLSDQNSTVREAAAEALGKLGDSAAIPYLTKALQDKEAFVRLAATVSLSHVTDPTNIKSLLSALKDADSHVRWAAVQSLIDRGNDQAVPALIELLEDNEGPYWEDQKICDLAVAALRRINSPEAQKAVEGWHPKRVRQG